MLSVCADMDGQMTSIDWAKCVPPGGRVFLGSGAATPQALVQSFLGAAKFLKDVEVVHIHTMGPTPWVDLQFDGILRTNTFFLTPELRDAVDAGRADYTPCSLSEVPGLFVPGLLPIDVALVMVSPPDASGYVSLGVSVDVTLAAVRTARLVIAQINPMMPTTGGEARLHVSRLHAVIEHAQVLPELPLPEEDSVRAKIAAYVAEVIEDGSTIQLGLGVTARSIPQALTMHRHLGIHTGMLSDGLIALIRAGVVDNSRKGLHNGKTVCSHVAGTTDAYRFVDGNPDIEFHGSEYVNNPVTIARLHRMVAVNGARQIDLTGQVVRDSRGHHFHGGVGALLDFARGAAMAPQGRPIIVLPSASADGRKSRIVANLAPGTGIATGRTDVHKVITEYGIARLHGRSIRERVVELVQIAHPDFREDLMREARHWGWVPRIFAAAPPSLKEGTGRQGIESRRIKLGGKPYVLRPLHPSDMRRLQEFFYSHDPETVRMRYGYARDSMPSESAYKLVAVDQNRDLALAIVETLDDGEALKAIGRFYLDENETSAEVAFVVHEDSRRLGMASVLLEEMARLARRRNITTFWASVLRRNRSMAGLFLRHGAKAQADEDPSSQRFFMDVGGILAMAEEARDARATQEPGEAVGPAVAVGAVWDGVFERHDTGPGHPESAVRYRAVWESMRRLEEAHVVQALPVREAKMDELLLCHSVHYIEIARMDVESFADQLRTGDVALCEDSFHVARLAAGSCLAATEAVVEGRVRRAFCAVRPPGHHASPARGMGFCIFNNIALAARHAIRNLGLKRALIFDWDVHHGNGTQDIFWEDPGVFFFSSHQWPLFPGSGAESERGGGPGLGTTMNLPLREGTGADVVLAAIDGPLTKAMDAFKPDILFISAGFDARVDDPLGGLDWTDGDFVKLTRRLVAMAEKYCQGRIVSVLEGGYNPAGLASAVEAHVRALAEDITRPR